MSPAPSGAHPSPEEVDALIDRADAGTDVYDVDLEERVGAHVATCEECAELLTGMREVRDLLRAEGARVPEVPADLDQRLGAALARAAAERDGTIVPLDRGRRSGGNPGTGTGSGATGADDAGTGRATRVPRWLTVAAGLAVLGGAGAASVQLFDGDSSEGSASLSAGAAPEATETAVTASTSGRDYRQADLGPQVLALLTAPGDTGADASAPDDAGASGDVPRASAATTLGVQSLPGATAASPLTEPAVLARCLQALGEEQTPLAVDVGTWQGEPAAVVVVPGGSASTVQVWVVGERCGQDGDDLRHFQLVQR